MRAVEFTLCNTETGFRCAYLLEPSTANHLITWITDHEPPMWHMEVRDPEPFEEDE